MPHQGVLPMLSMQPTIRFLWHRHSCLCLFNSDRRRARAVPLLLYPRGVGNSIEGMALAHEGSAPLLLRVSLQLGSLIGVGRQARCVVKHYLRGSQVLRAEAAKLADQATTGQMVLPISLRPVQPFPEVAHCVQRLWVTRI